MWVSNPEHYNKPVVHYGNMPLSLNHVVSADWHTYNVGKVGGFHGRIYVAVMKDLAPFTRYYYKVGDTATGTFSKVKYFTAPPLRVQTLD